MNSVHVCQAATGWARDDYSRTGRVFIVNAHLVDLISDLFWQVYKVKVLLGVCSTRTESDIFLHPGFDFDQLPGKHVVCSTWHDW